MQPGNSAFGIVRRTIAVPDTGFVADISGGFRGHPVHAQPPLRNVDVRQMVPGCASGVMVEVSGRVPLQPCGLDGAYSASDFGGNHLLARQCSSFPRARVADTVRIHA